MTTFKDAIILMKIEVEQVMSIFMSNKIIMIILKKGSNKRYVAEDTPETTEEKLIVTEQILMRDFLLVSMMTKPLLCPIGETY